jgi:hypothetical protein
VWEETMHTAGVYTSREATKHTQRLKEYVASAVAKAVQQEPKLQEALNEACKLPP